MSFYSNSIYSKIYNSVIYIVNGIVFSNTHTHTERHRHSDICVQVLVNSLKIKMITFAIRGAGGAAGWPERIHFIFWFNEIRRFAGAHVRFTNHITSGTDGRGP